MRTYEVEKIKWPRYDRIDTIDVDETTIWFLKEKIESGNIEIEAALKKGDGAEIRCKWGDEIFDIRVFFDSVYLVRRYPDVVAKES